MNLDCIRRLLLKLIDAVPFMPDQRGENWEEHADIDFLQDLYDKIGWNTWRGLNLKVLHEAIMDVWKDKLSRNVEEPIMVLDVGCFTGDYFGKLMEFKDIPQFRYFGVDITPEFVRRSSERWRDYQNARFNVMSAGDLRYEDSGFDVVFCFGLLIHVRDIRKSVSEFFRVSRQAVIISVDTTTTNKYTDIYGKTAKYYYRAYSEDWTRRILEEYGKIKKICKMEMKDHNYGIPLYNSVLYCLVDK